MVKANQRTRAPALQNESFDPLTCSDMDLPDDSCWVMVKKQRVTILLPPLPVVEKPLAPKPHPKAEEGSLRTIVSKKDRQPVKLASECGVQSGRSVVPPLHLPVSRIPHSQTPDRPGTWKFQELLKTSKSSKGIEQMRRFGSSCSFPNGCALIKERLRARNLERKLESAGGLSRWLESLGLEQFVRIFERRSASKFHLARLTMNKLKDMGAVAVGPRRKLMHTIDCCCGL